MTGEQLSALESRLWKATDDLSLRQVAKLSDVSSSTLIKVKSML